MRKYIFLSFVFIALLLTVGIISKAYAEDYGLGDTGQSAGYDVNSDKQFEPIISRIIKGALVGAGFIFFAIMIYGGMRWMTARGNEEFTTKAKNAIEAAIIGLVITVSAYAISSFVLSKLNVSKSSPNSPSTPAQTCASQGDGYSCSFSDDPGLCGSNLGKLDCTGEQLCCKP